MISDTETINVFRSAMQSHGLVIQKEIVPDGKLHRFHADGDKPGSKNGWYILFNNEIPAGVFGSWKTGYSQKWTKASLSSMSTVERKKFNQYIKKAMIERNAETKKVRAEARDNAMQIWKNSPKASAEHSYLQNKKIKPFNLKQDDQDNLLIPLTNSRNILQSLQRISTKGAKRFLTGGAVAGHFYRFGNKDSDTIYICEGYATAASIYMATGGNLVVAFNAGNILSVAKAIRTMNPTRRIVICADNDQWTKGNPGVAIATEAAKKIGGEVIIPEFDDTTKRPTDFNDLHCLEGLDEVKNQIGKLSPKATINSRVNAISYYDFLAKQIPPRKTLLSPWLPQQGLCMIHAKRGVGKTHLSLGIACAVASGGKFLIWEAPHPEGVLLIDGEMPSCVLQERLKSIAATVGEPIALLDIVTPDEQELGMPDLGTKEGQGEINKHITENIKLVIVDNISTLVRSGRENEAEGWLLVQEWALQLRAKGISVLFIHHSNKGGGQRGTSKREDILDAVISLRNPKDYNPQNGANFEVHFEKSRGIYGEDVKPFEAKLETDAHGNATWIIKSLEDSTYIKVVNLFKEGLSQKEIAEDLEIHKSNVSRAVKRAKDNGEL